MPAQRFAKLKALFQIAAKSVFELLQMAQT
jgi:hypothetical protein